MDFQSKYIVYFKADENVNLNMVSSTSDHRFSGETINEKGLNMSEGLKPVPTCTVSPLYNQWNCYCMLVLYMPGLITSNVH